jgi:aspartate ammonia-lyase
MCSVEGNNAATPAVRTESDDLGTRQLPASCLYGIHTLRAMENFRIAGAPVHRELVKAYGVVKEACAKTNRAIGMWKESAKADAIEQACLEMAGGEWGAHVVVDSLQGGAGTSTNMNVNEVLANRALEILGQSHGSYAIVSPLDDINLHQSTNDTYPTALKLAAITMLRCLEKSVVELQEAFQRKEKEFAHVVKMARTELQDAVLITLGRTMGAFAEAINRDRWRISKCEERLRVVNLGGTAIGSGLGAPREFIFRVADELRDLTGIGFARGENMTDTTQNADVFVEVSGILKALAVSLVKISNDLRLMASGPDAGFGEITLPAVQAGSSIMPGKVNPVIPEAVAQAGIMVMSNDTAIAAAASAGNLELNQFMPVIAHALLQNLDYLRNACDALRERCIDGIEANEERCRRSVESATALATALIPAIGHGKAMQVAMSAKKEGISVRQAAVTGGFVTGEEFDRLVSPEAVCRLGAPLRDRRTDQ